MSAKDFDAPNREGLSFTRWLNAAGYQLDQMRPGEALTCALVDAWVAGEDPAEYRQDAPKRTDGVAARFQRGTENTTVIMFDDTKGQKP